MGWTQLWIRISPIPNFCPFPAVSQGLFILRCVCSQCALQDELCGVSGTFPTPSTTGFVMDTAVIHSTELPRSFSVTPGAGMCGVGQHHCSIYHKILVVGAHNHWKESGESQNSIGHLRGVLVLWGGRSVLWWGFGDIPQFPAQWGRCLPPVSPVSLAVPIPAGPPGSFPNILNGKGPQGSWNHRLTEC